MTVFSKQEARLIVHDRLQHVPSDDFQLMASSVRRQLHTLLSGMLENRQVRTILTYRAMPKWNEVDVTPLELKFDEIRFEAVQNIADAPFPSAEYDIILVPLLGFNHAGYRLGHGSGWYDKFLITQPEALKIGIGFEVSHIDFDPDDHDIRMNHIITEQGERITR